MSWDTDVLAQVPDSIAGEEAAFFTLAQTVMNGVRRSRVGWGESVAVFGLGILGQLAVRFCRLCGVRPVFGVDPAAKRRALLPEDAGIQPGMRPRGWKPFAKPLRQRRATGWWTVPSR